MFSVICVSLVDIYKNRFLAIVDPPKRWIKYFCYLLQFSNPLIVIICYLYTYFTTFHQACPETFDSELFVLEVNESENGLVEPSLVIFLTTQMFVCTSLTIRTLVLEIWSQEISAKCSSLWRKFLIFLIIQSAIPLSVLCLSYLWNLLPIKANSNVQGEFGTFLESESENALQNSTTWCFY